MTTPKKKRPPTRHKRTIAEELLAQWRDLRRTNDPENIATLLKVSKPTIDKALIYGCVQKQEIIDGINKFFADRLMAERDEAIRLLQLKRETEKLQAELKQSAA
jgi:nitrogen regulatory protein PII-like uncharacterized protein